MSLLILAFIVVLVLALACWLIQSAPFDARFRWALQAVAVVIAILVILSRAGLVSA